MNEKTLQEQVDYIIQNKVSDIDDINSFIQEISDTIKQDKSKGRELGILISELSNYKRKNLFQKKRKQIQSSKRRLITGVTDKKSYWQKVGDGWLKIGHRPGILFYDELLKDRTTSVLTLLGENEEPQIIKNIVKAKNMDWLWIPLANGKIPPKNILPNILKIFEILKNKLDNQERIYIHCAAGMHRTGMITNAFLIYLGYSPEEAFDLLFKLRPLTAQEVRNHRLEWGKLVFS